MAKTEDLEYQMKPVRTDLTLLIHSSWQAGRISGITEIEIFDENKNKIFLSSKNIRCENCGRKAIENIGKLVDRVKYTTDDEHMWYFLTPPPP